MFLIDPDGRDWEILFVRDEKNKTLQVNITYTAAVLNSSSSTIGTKKLASSIKSLIEGSYKGNYKEIGMVLGQKEQDEYDVSVNISVNIREISDKKDLADNEHLYEVRDDKEVDGVYGKVNKIGGKEIYLNAGLVPDMMNGTDNNTIIHETGHTAGLYHPDVFEGFAGFIKIWEGQYFEPKNGKNKNNAMYSGGSGLLNDKTSTEINQRQLIIMVDKIRNGDVNKD